MESEELEYILLRKPEVFVYKIPSRLSTGHKAELWEDLIWKGRIFVVGKGDSCIVRLVEKTSDSLFAKSVIDTSVDEAIEKVTDSSRYFALRLDDGQDRHSFVGVGFEDRNDAFDFIYTINEFLSKKNTRILDPSTGDYVHTGKYELKPGEQLKIHWKNMHIKSSVKSNCLRETRDPQDQLPFLLPPPSSSHEKRTN